MLQLDPARLGSLELDEMWVPYADLYDLDFLPTRLRLGNEEYQFDCSFLVQGHGALMPPKIRELRAAGKPPVVVERSDRYYVFVPAA
ncbi:MAG TPA: hypothetical protein VEZ14_10535 [Dehalococcoidia bacterium]|nr:hypothetical protein [Dehalococcoidia bacterium]